MKEYIGKCSNCQKDMYCLEGFFNGIVLENKEIICFDCHEKVENKENPQA
ncbi:hypothetical protein [Neobacillus sp. D3-1R]